ncbi:tRNA preQ1(34) S-adenosylmethionine ribosyltransferase-isomerase QueA [Candidatus Peregrinibacteria bacterium CG10_big_fil_rev_8_21_14_0_10_36_19]|nr:MAG: tRNA preQ1(34) S-adenosylmethionine ribosyltransferase-isomerase QueA [Candidatus Peregrinibacteria bacterium CG10_big_fil_rev_8_21_14_0_10_36_19]
MSQLRTQDFDFDLPEKFIAQDPVSPRDSAKLMVVKNGDVVHRKFYDVIDYLNSGDVLVVNRSKVIPARILFSENGFAREVFVLSNIDGIYNCLVKPGRAFPAGKVMNLDEKVEAEVLSINDDGTRNIKFSTGFDLNAYGSIPLPPYIKGSNSTDVDYQTVYAKESGSVAAPTAGLHFTDQLLAKLREKGVKVVEVLLHVGRGTFLPVSSELVENHKMHSEFYEIGKEACDVLNFAKSSGGKIFAVGTTSVRVLESVFDGKFSPKTGETDIFIFPKSYKWKVVDGLITNFHLPKSSLIMLVASFLENKGVDDAVPYVKELYELAKRLEYRFYSFGDAMIIL